MFRNDEKKYLGKKSIRPGDVHRTQPRHNPIGHLEGIELKME